MCFLDIGSNSLIVQAATDPSSVCKKKNSNNKRFLNSSISYVFSFPLISLKPKNSLRVRTLLFATNSTLHSIGTKGRNEHNALLLQQKLMLHSLSLNKYIFNLSFTHKDIYSMLLCCDICCVYVELYPREVKL